MSVNDYSYIIIGGSTKCATTSLFSYLADHPQITGSKIKESRFFWKGDYELNKEGVNIDDGISKFDTMFVDKATSKYRLEATPDYLYSEATARLIKENLKDVRLLFIVRDPIDRVISWFKFAKQLNLINSTVSIDEFIIEQLTINPNSNRKQYLHAVEQGRYGLYLENYVKHFGQSKIKVIRYEDITTNPLKALKTICDYINIDFDFYKKYDFKILNQSVNVENAKSYNSYRNLRRKIRRFFKNIIPSSISTPFKNVFKKVDSIYMSSATSGFEEIVISTDVRDRLIEYYSKDKANWQYLIK
jgi:hypothetical protein